MDIDVVGGRSVEAGEALAGGAASIRGSEIDVKYPEVKMSDLFPLESDEMPVLEPPAASEGLDFVAEEPPEQKQFKVYRTFIIDLTKHERITLKKTLKYILETYPDVTELDFSAFDGNPTDLKYIRKFKHLRTITVQYYGHKSKLRDLKMFTMSPTCTRLIFNECNLIRPDTKVHNARYHLKFAQAIAKNKVLQSLVFRNCQFHTDFLTIILQSKNISDIHVEGMKNLIHIHELLPSVLQNNNLLKFDFNPRILKYRLELLEFGGYELSDERKREIEQIHELWKQIDAHLQENRQRLMVFPVLAAMQLTGSRDKEVIIDLLPQISRLLGDPPISRQRAVQIVNQIEPMVGGKRKTAEAKPLPFMFQE